MTTRADFFREMGVVRDHPYLDKMTEKAYDDLELQIWKENLESSPHGRPWFTSFHASAFPDKDKPCARKSLYGMMDIPDAAPVSAYLRGVADIGHAVENQIVYRWAKYGKLLGVKTPKNEKEEIIQVKFTDPEYWLTGSADAILDMRPEWQHVLPIDIKSKKHEVVQEMIQRKRGYEEKHFYQVQAYLYLCRRFHKEKGWEELGLKPAEGAFIYYVSREDPRTTAEFYIPVDHEVIEKGLESLTKWKNYFLENQLPERDKGWRWTEEPCKWCKFKKHACKPDWKNKTEKLSDSEAISFAKSIRPKYDFEEAREEVIKAWN